MVLHRVVQAGTVAAVAAVMDTASQLILEDRSWSKLDAKRLAGVFSSAFALSFIGGKVTDHLIARNVRYFQFCNAAKGIPLAMLEGGVGSGADYSVRKGIEAFFPSADLVSDNERLWSSVCFGVGFGGVLGVGSQMIARRLYYDNGMRTEMIDALIDRTKRPYGTDELKPTVIVTPPDPGWGKRWIESQFYTDGAAGAIKYPRKALEEWGTCMDELSEWAHVRVMPYTSTGENPFFDIVYPANGPYVREIDGALCALEPDFTLVSRKGEPWEQEELLRQLGFRREPLTDAAGKIVKPRTIFQPLGGFEGQADISRIIPARNPNEQDLVFFGHGVRTEIGSFMDVVGGKIMGLKAEVAPFFRGQRMIVAKMQKPYFHQDTWLNILQHGDETYALYNPNALVGIEEIGAEGIQLTDPKAALSYFEDLLDRRGVTRIPISDEDGIAYAANALQIGSHVAFVKSAHYRVSAALREKLRGYGFQIHEFDYDELFEKGGGGTRCSVNELRGLTRARFPEFFARLDRYSYVPGSWREIRHLYPRHRVPQLAAEDLSEIVPYPLTQD